MPKNYIRAQQAHKQTINRKTELWRLRCQKCVDPWTAAGSHLPIRQRRPVASSAYKQPRTRRYEVVHEYSLVLQLVPSWIWLKINYTFFIKHFALVPCIFGRVLLSENTLTH